MSDLISRQAAIDAIPQRIKGVGGESWMMTYRRSGYNDCVDACLDAIRNLPSTQPTYTDAEIQKMQDLESAEIEKAYQLGYEEGKKDAQPEKRTNERTKTHACDCISRAGAIDHLRLIIDATNTDSGYNMGFIDGLEFCISHMSTMPSAQPERDIPIDCIIDEDGDAICPKCGADMINGIKSMERQ